MDKQAWTKALKEYAGRRRKRRPLPDRPALSPEEEWQCRIIGSELLAWGRRGLPRIDGQREMLKRLAPFEPGPIVVFTTSISGLVAAREILAKPCEKIVCLLPEEFALFERRNRDDGCRFHIRRWSYFRAPDPRETAEATQAHPNVPPAELRIHRAGDLWGAQCGSSADHLWRWTGQELVLLQEGFSQIVY